MAKAKGSTKTGGRTKGTPNRVTQLGREAICKMLQGYVDGGLMDSDFAELEARDRLVIAEKLMQYAVPRLQAVSVDMNNTSEKLGIDERLRILANLNEEEK